MTGLKRHLEVFVIVVGEALGPPVGAGEGREFARHRDEVAEQPLGVDAVEALEMPQHRLPAVKQLEQQIGGEGLGAAVGPLDRAQRQLLLPALEPAQDVDQEARHRRRRANVEQRRDVRLVPDDPLAADLADAREAKLRPPGEVGLLDPEAQVRQRDLDRFGRAVGVGNVDRLALADQVAGDARVARQRVGVGNRALSPRRQRQINDLAADLVVDVERERRRQAAGHLDDFTIGHHRDQAA